MDIRIGVTDNPREIVLVLSDDSDRDKVMKAVDDALSGKETTLWLTDEKGRDVGIAAARLAYVEVGPEGSTNPIGFG